MLTGLEYLRRILVLGQSRLGQEVAGRTEGLVYKGGIPVIVQEHRFVPERLCGGWRYGFHAAERCFDLLRVVIVHIQGSIHVRDRIISRAGGTRRDNIICTKVSSSVRSALLICRSTKPDRLIRLTVLESRDCPGII